MHQNECIQRINTMINNYNQTFPGLEQYIIKKIYKLENRKLFIKQSIYGVLSFGSFIGVISSGVYAVKTLAISGVYNYISLLFSDIQALSYWKELSLSIAESLPFLAIAICFGICALFLWSILKTVKIHEFKKALI